MTSVMTNSVAPTAKIVLYSIDPVGTSPCPVPAMNAVIVCTASIGFQVQLGWPPAAISTIIVSPTAREIAGHGCHRVLRDGGDGGQKHHAHHQAGAERAEDPDGKTKVPQQWAHEREREVAVDDRRDPGEDLQQGLEHVPGLHAGVLTEVDRGPKPERDADHTGA